jgi:hypothetical protein
MESADLGPRRAAPTSPIAGARWLVLGRRWPVFAPSGRRFAVHTSRGALGRRICPEWKQTGFIAMDEVGRSDSTWSRDRREVPAR